MQTASAHVLHDFTSTINAESIERPSGFTGNNDTEASASDADTNTEAEIETVFDSLLSGMPMKDVSGVSSEMMDALYAQAYQLYQSNRLDDAENFFRLLCVYDFHNVDYVLGLGAVYQLKKNYEKAIELYAAAYVIGDKELRPILYAGQCSLLMKDKGRAKQCFELVIDESEDADLKTTAQSFLSALDAHSPSHSTGVT